MPAPVTRPGAAPFARRALAHAMRGEFGLAIMNAEAAEATGANDLATLDPIGNAWALCHRPQAAYDAFHRAVALAPGEPGLLANLAATARFIGRDAEAEALYDRVIALAPTNWPAYRSRSELRRQAQGRNHVTELVGLLVRGNLPPDGDIQLSYALGKEYEDLGDYDRAFAAFTRGARIRRARMRYAVQEDCDTLALIATTFNARYCAQGRASATGGGPIFIVGLPRAGSTLLEQKLAGHDAIQPVGELQSFGAAVIGAVAATSDARGKASLVRASAAIDPARIGAGYHAAVAPLRDGRPFFTDKLPFNLLYAGLIARALPEARIVHIAREPRDACVAIFKTLFDEAYPYSYDLAELGAYHGAHSRLVGHWRKVLGERLIETSYEALVADPRGTAAEILRRIGLDPTEVVDRRPAAVMTASASQVREAVHTRSVGAWRRYEAHLAPLVDALGEPRGGQDRAVI